MENLKNKILPAVFVIILILPFTDSLFNLMPKVEVRENRALASKPELDFTLLDDFPIAYDEYFSDNFDFRNQLLKFNSSLKLDFLDVAPVSSKGMIGKDGWLYLTKSMDDVYLGKNKVDEKKLRRYYDIIKYRKEFLDSINCKYYFVIAPVKTSVYPEFLTFDNGEHVNNSLTDQIVDLLDTVKGMKLIDLRKALLNAKGDTRLFHKTDNHWNSYGSFVGYHEIMTQLSYDFPELKPHDISEYEIDSVQINGLNLTRILGIYHNIYENKVNVTPKFETLSSKGKKQGYPVMKWFSFKKQYEQVYSVNNDSLPKLLLIRDSFGKTVIPFLSEHFNKSVYIFDGWHHGLNEKITRSEKPDIFIQLILESHLPNLVNNSKKP
jgi:hypothetical protein